MWGRLGAHTAPESPGCGSGVVACEVSGGVQGLSCGCLGGGAEMGTQEKFRQRRWPGGGRFQEVCLGVRAPPLVLVPVARPCVRVRWGWAPADIT